MAYSKAYQDVRGGRVREDEGIGFFKNNRVAIAGKVIQVVNQDASKISLATDALQTEGVGKGGSGPSDNVSGFNPPSYHTDIGTESPTPPTPPPVPTGLVAVADDGQVALSWNASTGAASYMLETSNGTVTTDTTTGTTFTKTGLTNGTAYSFRVKAINADGESEYCVPVESTPESSSFMFTIAVTEGYEYTLPLTDDAEYDYDFVVQWGDGTESTVTAADDPNRVHTYAVAGTYVVGISGTCNAFQMPEDASCEIYQSVESWGDVHFKAMNFGGCVNLTSIPDEDGKLTELVDGYYLLGGCVGITEIPSGLLQGCSSLLSLEYAFFGLLIAEVPAGLFDDCTSITNFYGCFYSCESLAAIPVGLFDNCTSVTSFFDCFSGCANLVEIPVGLFDNCPSVTDFSSCFASCGTLVEIPVGLFDNCTSVTNFTYCFFGCANLVEIPAGLFDNCASVTSFNGCFSGCANLVEIPVGLFDNCTAVTNFSSCFSDSFIAAIPSDLFDNCPSVTNFSDCFSNCANLTGNAPTLWLSYPSANGTRCFRSSIGITNWPDIPVDWK